MNKKCFISWFAAMSAIVAMTTIAAMASKGKIGFNGRVVAATEAVTIHSDGDIQAHRAASHISSQLLVRVKPVFNTQSADDLFDYFASYAPVTAKVITVTYH